MNVVGNRREFFSSSSFFSTAFTGLCILIILSSLSCAKADASHGRAEEKKENITRTCIVCDSRKNPECANDEHLRSKSAAFSQVCEPTHTWCYMAQGNIYTLDYTVHGKKDAHLEKVKIKKVDRGCTKPHHEENCTRITQEDGFTDFKVCPCKEELCNLNSTIMKRANLNPNTAEKSSRVWGCFVHYALFTVIFHVGF